jgi:hypothetical protein
MYTPVEIDKVRNFRYGMKALSLIEKKFNRPLSKIDMQNLTIEESAVLIWAGLVHEDKELTVEKVIDIIDEKGNFQEVIEAMNKAMEDAFGNNKNVKKA